MRRFLVLALLVVSGCSQTSPLVTDETMPECMTRIHKEDPLSAPIGLHNACLEFVKEANGGKAEIIHPPESQFGPVLRAIAGGIAAEAESHPAPAYYTPLPMPVTTRCQTYGSQTTCMTY